METGSRVRRLHLVYIEYLEKRIAPATFLVTNLNDAGAGSLRDAVDQANAAPGTDTITFKGVATSGEIALTSGEIDIIDSVRIKGPGAGKLTIDAQDLSRIFNIDDGTAAVKKVTISGLSMVDGNSGVGNGGGILSLESLTLVNSVVSGSRAQTSASYADGHGGGIYIDSAGQAVIRDSKITGNIAEGGAGGVWAVANGGVKIINTVVSGNTATLVGGGVYTRIFSDGVGDILIAGSTLTDNFAWRGGGISAENNVGRITLRDTLISGNRATVEFDTFRTGGGGLYLAGGITLIERCTISNNVSTDNGGGLSTSDFESMTIKNSKIINNLTTSATGAGGGLRFFGEGNNATIQNTLISGNVSSGDGGGLFAINTEVTIRKSTISGNTALADGGGIYGTQGTLDLDRTIVRDNLAGEFGGGISAVGTGSAGIDVRITRSLFATNSADTGGGIDTRIDGTVTIGSSRFLQNAATESDGGGLYLRSYLGRISITGSLIVENTASYNGGGLAVRGSVTPVTITSTVIRDNIAARDSGGGVAFFIGTLNLSESSILDNIAGRRGGGIWIGPTAAVELNGSNVTGNIAPSGPQIYGP